MNNDNLGKHFEAAAAQATAPPKFPIVASILLLNESVVVPASKFIA